MVTAGIHGDEIASRNVGKSMRRAVVPKGKLVVLPVANTMAAKMGYRGIDFRDAATQPNEFDLNRKFPSKGECEGSIAQAIYAEVAKHDPDYLLDLHTSKGSYGRSDVGGVGQMLWTTQQTSFIRHCQQAAQWANKKFSLGTHNEFRVMASVRGDDPMMVDRAFSRLGTKAVIIEASRDGTTMHEREDWLNCVVSTLMKQYGQQPSWS